MPELIGELPREYSSLFQARTAHEAVRAARLLLSGSAPDKQRRLLNDRIFLKAVHSALAGLDECRDQHITELEQSVSSDNLPLAEDNISDF